MHCETLSASVSALIMTTGISRWSGSLLIVLRTSSPFRSGIIRSSRTRLNDQRNRLVSTGRSSDPLVTIAFEHQLQRISIILIVIDNKDAREIRCHEHLDLFSICGSDGRRWLWPRAAMEGQGSSQWGSAIA